MAKSSAYDPPEAKSGRIGAAGDIWALGVTLVEALTQRPPAWSEGSDTPTLPESLPPAFAETIRRCLSRNPADRPTAVDLEAEMRGGAGARRFLMLQTRLPQLRILQFRLLNLPWTPSRPSGSTR